ncbi:MAG: S9 family peptidase [Flavobacteriia bacterium]|nr:S9 family peptidase [Flavobacteriia bacterium]
MGYKTTFLVLIFFGFILNTNAQELSVEKIWKNYEFFGKSISGFNSMNDGEHFTQITEKDKIFFITKHNFKDYKGDGEIILNLSALKIDNKAIQIDEYEFNNDETKLLLKSETTPIYRHSYTAVYYLYDLKTKQIQALDNDHKPQTLAEYSPDGTKVSFIHKNNIYVKDLVNGKVKQLTKDGKSNKIINGTTDWVYEEEFAITKAYVWSPDSKYLAFLRFNEKNVKEFSLTYYKNLYPDIEKFKYPKAGEDNSKVSANIIQIKKGKITPIDLGEYEYIPRLKFAPNENNLIIQTLNRHQNKLKYFSIRINGKKVNSKLFFEENSKTYIDVDDNLLILKDGKSIIRTSESNGYNHIYQLDFDGKTTQITKGNWDVIQFLGIDEVSQMIYYTSAEKSPIYKGIYKIDLSGSNKKAISEETGTNDAEFSTGMKYFIKSHSTANSPAVITLCDNDGKEIQTLEDNHELFNKLKTYHLSPKEFIKIQGAQMELNAWIIKPQNFDPNKKYPVYFHIYGGPGNNVVEDAYNGGDFLYHQLLAQKGYIVISVDPRGTMYRGSEFKKSTYLQLGKLEVEDMIACAKEVAKWNYVDPSRIGIQGWSFGGYLTSLAITKGADFFKMGIAVAPVTNWKYYDNIYTERFMQTPKENSSGYEENSPINFVSQLKGNYFIIHGSADDNVHYQNTMEMINALVKANKQFDMFIYPNKNHGIYGGNTRNHLYTMLLDYTLKNL